MIICQVKGSEKSWEYLETRHIKEILRLYETTLNALPLFYILIPPPLSSLF